MGAAKAHKRPEAGLHGFLRTQQEHIDAGVQQNEVTGFVPDFRNVAHAIWFAVICNEFVTPQIKPVSVGVFR